MSKTDEIMQKQLSEMKTGDLLELHTKEEVIDDVPMILYVFTYVNKPKVAFMFSYPKGKS